MYGSGQPYSQVIKFIELKLAEALNVVEDEKLVLVLNNGQVGTLATLCFRPLIVVLPSGHCTDTSHCAL